MGITWNFYYFAENSLEWVIIIQTIEVSVTSVVRYIQRREEDVTKWSFSINLRFHRMKDEDVRRHGIGSLYACKPPATFIIAECTLHSQIAILYLFYSTPFSIVVA